MVSLIFGEPDATLREIETRFPRNALRDGHSDVFDRALLRVEDHTAPMPGLRFNGTAFQQSVWRALREIPHGRTRTYSEVARAIGRPHAVRAVAGACAANPIAILIPCHRVIRSDGALAGYRWGVEIKRELLEAERALSPCA